MLLEISHSLPALKAQRMSYNCNVKARLLNCTSIKNSNMNNKRHDYHRIYEMERVGGRGGEDRENGLKKILDHDTKKSQLNL
jgi:hypothetical protein